MTRHACAAVIAMRAMVVRANRRLIHAGHEGRAAGRTNRCSCIEARVTHSVSGKLVQIWRRDFLRPVAAKVLAEILRNEPQNVRPLRGSRSERR